MPLAADVDREHLAGITHGFVGADLEALCREAAMNCLRRILPNIDFALTSIPYERLSQLEVEMNDFFAALREVEPSAMREVFIETPNVKWEDVGGLGAVKQRLREAVQWPLEYPALFTQPGIAPVKGILLAGAPGCGKTLLAKALASQSGINFISVKGPELLSRYVGESERAVREIFHKARHAAPCMIFFDEIDSIAPARGMSTSDSGVTERVLSQLLTELDGIEELKGVLVLAATNRLDRIDPALLRPGRFEEIIRFPLPGLDDRKEILAVHLRGKPLAATLTQDDLAARTENFSGAELASLCAHAAVRAVRRAVAQSSSAAQSDIKVTIEDADLTAALEEITQGEEKISASI
jgi:transitional endoplasmic reticulum ATPase